MKAVAELPDAELVQQLTSLIVKLGSFKFGHFKLASGAESDYYFNGKTVLSDPQGLSLISELFYRKIEKLNVQSVGGLAHGSIPISTAIAQLSFSKGHPIPSFYVRSERKDHGDKTLVEGNLKENSRVVLVDDVATKGTSIQKAINTVKAMNCAIVEIIVLMDRGEGAEERFRSEGLTFESILKREDFITSRASFQT